MGRKNTRERHHLTDRTLAFFQQSPPNQFCTGAKSECAELAKDDGYRVIDWNAEAAELPVGEIKLLQVLPTRQQLKRALLPAFVPGLRHLKNLVFPLAFLRNPDKNRLPAALRSLMLVRDSRYEDILEGLLEHPVAWSEDVVAQKLEALRVIGGKETAPVVESFSEQVFPQLRFLGFDLSRSSGLDVFQRFSALSDVELQFLKDHDVFTPLHHLPLVSLDLGGTNNTFDLSGVKKLQTLKFLRLNSIRSEIDCALFRELPELQELVVLNSKKIKNVEALLECRALTSIDFLDCSNPFKGIAATFERGDYELLNIRYA